MFDEYTSKNVALEQLVKDVNEGVQIVEAKMNDEADKDKKEMYNKMLIKVREVLARVEKEKSDALRVELLSTSMDVLSTWLDKLHGKEVTDNSIFNKLPRHYEGEFHQEMAKFISIIITQPY